MQQRINVQEKGQNAYKALFSIGAYLAKSTIKKELLHLLFFRVSQINGCGYCLDMHSKDLRSAGETEQRLYLVSAWREAPFYNDQERAAFAFAEALTNIEKGEVPNDVYAAASQQFSETEMIDLTMAIIAINSWNRLNIAFINVLCY
jgi:AhpD family alkylhydroperoxidase